jgi:hypothetical protein
VKIKAYTFQLRRDFSAVLECEHCGAEQDLHGGYNDEYYHNRVLPSIRCLSCGNTRGSETSVDHAAVDFAQRRSERFSRGDEL